MADALKAEGNALFAAKKFAESIEKFSQAIELDPENHVLYSNRSGAHASLKDWSAALADASKTTALKPDWAKGWNRKATALHGDGNWAGAADAFEAALKLDPKNAQAEAGLATVMRALEDGSRDDFAASPSAGDASMGIGQMFNDPNMLQKLAANPKTAAYLADPSFMNKLQQLQQNPNAASDYLQDPRFLQAVTVLLGLDMQFGQPGEPGGPGASGTPGAAAREAEEDVEMPDARSVPEPEESPEEKAAKEAKANADALKKTGTEFYKKREFDDAIAKYTEAWETHHDIAYKTNEGAARFEKGDYEGCIKACEEAVEYGREVYADFKIIAKAFARIGTAYEKLGDLANAVLNYQKAQTEHRTPEVLAKLRAAEKAKITADKESYMDPDEAEKARELGNAKFKESDWPGAVDAYSEMIKRAPQDSRGYSNRAACFIKLLEFPSAVQDCDEAIKRDPSFIRAYLRKAQAYFTMREFNKCIDVCAEAVMHDKDGKNAREIQVQETKALEAQYSARDGETEQQTMERVQRDPEIVSILQDPVMNSILQQAKEDPAALQEHLKNPGIRAKIQKLVHAGVIRMGR